MTVAFLIPLATFLLEDKDFLSLGRIVEDCSLDYGTFHIRCSDLDISVIVDEKHFVKLYRSAFFCRETVDENLFASLNLELLACNFYDCVHIL